MDDFKITITTNADFHIKMELFCEITGNTTDMCAQIFFLENFGQETRFYLLDFRGKPHFRDNLYELLTDNHEIFDVQGDVVIKGLTFPAKEVGDKRDKEIVEEFFLQLAAERYMESSPDLSFLEAFADRN